MSRQFVASLEHLREMIAFIIKGIEPVGFGEGARNQIELASEEVLVNIISHAYQNHNSSNDVEIDCRPQKDRVHITIQDHGIPFNPLREVGHFDPKSFCNDGSVGGYGVFLITKMMDDVEYQRVDGCNQLTLTKICVRMLSSAG